jgi:hypothetical protein
MSRKTVAAHRAFSPKRHGFRRSIKQSVQAIDAFACKRRQKILFGYFYLTKRRSKPHRFFSRPSRKIELG